MVDLSVMPMGYIVPETVTEMQDGGYFVKVKGFGDVYPIQYHPITDGVPEVYFGKYDDYFHALHPAMQTGLRDRVHRFFWHHLN